MLAIDGNDEWLIGRGYIAKYAMVPLLEKQLHWAAKATTTTTR